jgi:tRNA-modifying protein YgfZ
MVPAKIALLPDRSIVRVAGADAKKLLHGLISNDLELLEKQAAIHAALLSPQGKILFEFFVVAAPTGFLLETARAQSAALLRRLSLYKLRAKVELSDAGSDYRVLALWQNSPDRLISGNLAFADPRLLDLGMRIIAETRVAGEAAAAVGTVAATAQDWHAHRIRLGVPEAGRDYPLGDTFLHEANFDQLHGVSFDKGCFVGQEVASRMQHRGGGRRRVVPVAAEAQLTSAAAIKAGPVPLGALGSVDGRRALALLRLDRAAEALANGVGITAADIPITLLQPSWASFAVPMAARTEAP